jgi:hypothetical protein
MKPLLKTDLWGEHVLLIAGRKTESIIHQTPYKQQVHFIAMLFISQWAGRLASPSVLLH